MSHERPVPDAGGRGSAEVGGNRRLPTPLECPLLSVAEVSEIMREGEKAIRAAIARGQIKAVRVGRYVRVPTAALWALLEIPPVLEPPVDVEDS